MDSEVVSLPPEVREGVDRLASDWTAGGHVGRLWSRDAALWTGGDESRWLGWLDIAGTQLEHLGPLQTLQQDMTHGPFDHAVLLGMGGSSLCPDVLRQSFGRVAGAPDLRVLDSTDPAQVRSVEQRIDLRRTLFIVSSKSGTTLEPTLLYRYFRHRVQSVMGEDKAGAQFIAVTDPGSQLEQDAVAGEFRQVYHGVPDIGGRYSALSHFGMVPAAVMGLGVGDVAGEVGPAAVGLLERPVDVVAKVGSAEQRLLPRLPILWHPALGRIERAGVDQTLGLELRQRVV